MKRFTNFVDYWKWATYLTQEERWDYVKSLKPKDRKILYDDYHKNWSESFLAVYVNAYNLDSYRDWTKDKAVEERLKLIFSMSQDHKKALITECSRRRKNMTTPRYELRFHNGDIFFSDKNDHQLALTANIVVDHVEKNVVKNRTGHSGRDAYEKLFPPKEDAFSFAIKANVQLKQNGCNLEVWKGTQLLRTFTEDEHVHFAIWRLLAKLAEASK